MRLARLLIGIALGIASSDSGSALARDRCDDPGASVRLRLSLGTKRVPLQGAMVTESACGRTALTDAKGTVELRVPTGACFHVTVDHADAEPTAIGKLRADPDRTRSTPWELSPRAEAVRDARDVASGRLEPRWMGDPRVGTAAGISARIAEHPNAVVTYLHDDRSPGLAMVTTGEGRAAYISIAGLPNGSSVVPVFEQPGAKLAVNPESDGMCRDVPVIAGRATLFLVRHREFPYQDPGLPGSG